MKLRTILISALFVLFVYGCSESIQKDNQELIQEPVEIIKLHPELGTHLMIIPEGTKIGKYVTPEEGVFFSKSVFIKMMIDQQEREKRLKQRPERFTRH